MWGAILDAVRVPLPQDICKPETTRLRRNLSAIINFAKFREEKLVPYTEMQEQTIVLLEETEELENTNCQLVSPLPLPPHYLPLH